MRAQFAIVGGNAKAGSAVSGIKNAGTGNTSVRLITAAKKVSPLKTWGYLADLLHLKTRTAKHRAAHTRRLSDDDIAALLQSDDGIHFLVAIMDKARPKWWRMFLKMGVLGGIERRREADLQLLRNVAHVSDQTAAELPAALMVQDEEFFGPVFDALDAVARGQDRAMAKTIK